MSKSILPLAAALVLAATPLAAQVANPTHNPQDVPGTQNSPNKTNSRAASEWPTGMPNEAQVKLHLKADGYTDIHDVKRSAGGWSAKAMYQGKPVTVAIGPDGSIARR